MTSVNEQERNFSPRTLESRLKDFLFMQNEQKTRDECWISLWMGLDDVRDAGLLEKNDFRVYVTPDESDPSKIRIVLEKEFP